MVYEADLPKKIIIDNDITYWNKTLWVFKTYEVFTDSNSDKLCRSL
jgi:hypothetical protein